jgi:hypothetical protein
VNDPVLFPDSAAVVIDGLLNTLPDDGYDIDVFSSVPNPRPTEFVVVERVGGPRANIAQDSAHLAVDCWSTSDRDAHDLAQIVRARINAMRGTMSEGGAVGRVDELSGPSRNPDPASSQDRYSFQVVVAVRGATLDTGS